LALGTDLCDRALTESAEARLEYNVRGVFRDAQELRYRPPCFVRITSLGDGIYHLRATLGREEESVQNR